MKSTMKSLLTIFMLLSSFWLPAAAGAQETDKSKHYIYMLHVAPAMQDQKSWTDADNRVVGAHFARLQKASKTGQVILAGRTTESLDKTFGLVIFKADSLEAAERFMAEDPAVVAKLMTATLHPYAIALQASTTTAATSSSPKAAEQAQVDAQNRGGSESRSPSFFRGRCFAHNE